MSSNINRDFRSTNEFFVEQTPEVKKSATAQKVTSYATQATKSLGVNETDKKGREKLYKAVKEGNLEKVKKLIAKGVNIHIENHNNHTPLDLAFLKFSKAMDNEKTKKLSFNF